MIFEYYYLSRASPLYLLSDSLACEIAVTNNVNCKYQTLQFSYLCFVIF